MTMQSCDVKKRVFFEAKKRKKKPCQLLSVHLTSQVFNLNFHFPSARDTNADAMTDTEEAQVKIIPLRMEYLVKKM
jgi:hypothetical protein